MCYLFQLPPPDARTIRLRHSTIGAQQETVTCFLHADIVYKLVSADFQYDFRIL